MTWTLPVHTILYGTGTWICICVGINWPSNDTEQRQSLTPLLDALSAADILSPPDPVSNANANTSAKANANANANANASDDSSAGAVEEKVVGTASEVEEDRGRAIAAADANTKVLSPVPQATLQCIVSQISGEIVSFCKSNILKVWVRVNARAKVELVGPSWSDVHRNMKRLHAAPLLLFYHINN